MFRFFLVVLLLTLCCCCSCQAASTVGNAYLSGLRAAGAVAGSVLLLCVAIANIFTCKLLLRASVATGATDYEQLAFAVGGTKLKVGRKT